MQCTRASPRRDSGTMSGLENSTELFNDLRSQQFLPKIITSFHHDSCPQRDSVKNGGKKKVRCICQEKRKQKNNAIVGFTGEKNATFEISLVEMVPSRKGERMGSWQTSIKIYWDSFCSGEFQSPTGIVAVGGCCLDPVHLGGRLKHKTQIGRFFVFTIKSCIAKNKRPEQTLIALIAFIACKFIKFVAKQPSPATILPRSDAWNCWRSNVARNGNEGECDS